MTSENLSESGRFSASLILEVDINHITTCYTLLTQHFFNPSTTQYSLQLKPIVLATSHAASHIAWVYSIVEERVSQELREKLRVGRWPVEKDVTDASDFIPRKDFR